jgi:hypothetical protein
VIDDVDLEDWGYAGKLTSELGRAEDSVRRRPAGKIVPSVPSASVS